MSTFGFAYRILGMSSLRKWLPDALGELFAYEKMKVLPCTEVVISLCQREGDALDTD
jgi:hypothetical protein